MAPRLENRTFTGVHPVHPRPQVCRLTQEQETPIYRDNLKPSCGLEPQTPSLPCAANGLPWVAIGCGSACLSGFRARPICHRLPPVAPAGLHKRSMVRSGIADADRVSGARAGRPNVATSSEGEGPSFPERRSDWHGSAAGHRRGVPSSLQPSWAWLSAVERPRATSVCSRGRAIRPSHPASWLPASKFSGSVSSGR